MVSGLIGNASITNSILIAVDKGVEIGGAVEGSIAVNDNVITTEDGPAVDIVHGAFDTNVSVSRNTIAPPTGGNLFIGTNVDGNQDAGDTCTLLTRRIRLRRQLNTPFVTGTFHRPLKRLILPSSTIPARVQLVPPMTSDTNEQVCMTFQGNSDDGGAAVEIENPPNSGDITVFPGDMPSPVAASIAANNTLGGGTITVGANVTAGPPCPTP